MTRSKLTTQIALQSGLIVFGTMLVYALVQVGNGEGSLGSLFVRHAWHSVAIAVVVFLILQWRFQAMIYRPLETICEHGHEMSQGIFRFKHYPRTDNELEDVMQTMNFMAAHLERAQATPWKHYADSIDTFLGMIQSRKDLPIDVHAEIQMIIDNMRKMEVAVSQFHPSGTKQDGEVNGHSTKTDGCHPDSSSGVSAILQTHSKLKREGIPWAIHVLGEEAARPLSTPVQKTAIPARTNIMCG